MSKTYDQGREEIAKLCRYFADNRHDFFSLGVKEAHVRQSLIDPFFEALGWDMRNAAMTALQYREVIPEDSLEIEGQQKAPDYTFRVGTLAKFYTEAKKCGVNINADPGPAYQLRRYGWSAKVPLSILTDFEELGIYDCSLRPRPADKASFGRIQYYRSEEYPDRWRELWDIFSREAVWAGAYDRYAASKRKRGTSEVDSEFLKEIEGWRDSLARNIALRNLYLGYDDLNTAVQRTIDRIIFLRMAEDRGSESYGQLLKLCERPDIYARFVGDLCRKADEKYNSGIFHFKKEEGVAESPDLLTPKLQIDDKVFKPILQNLYFENGSPYHFGVLPVEILGTVYERFLGKVIRLTADHRAKVEEKPEVRKAGGVYYTPAYIVDYIVKNTVGKMIEGKSPVQLSGGKNSQPLRVLDMACGSGSFLLGAYQCLLDHCQKWYLENRPEKHKEAVYFDGRRKFWRLTITEKKRILTTHIFGVDIDLQAVEVSKLSLLLKVLEGETDETVGQSRQLFHERALPNLSNNIKCGNSLISPDYFSGRLIPDPDEMKRVNPFDWQREFPDAMKSGGFDCVIGNPPYLFITEVSKSDREYYQTSFKTINYRFDLYGSFIEKALTQIIRTNGSLGFIIPHTLLSNDSFKSLRSLLARNTHLYQIVDLGPGIFQDAKNETMLIFFQKTIPDIKNKVEVIRTNSKEFLTKYNKSSIAQCKWADEDGNSWLVRTSKENISILDRFEKQTKKLGDFCTANQGLRTGNNERYLSDKPKGDIWKPAAGGKEIGRYLPIPKTLFVYYDPKVLDAPRRPEIFISSEKIVVQEIRNISLTRRIVATLDTDKTICLQSTNVINLKIDVNVGIYYILGILNSSAVNYYFRCRFPGNNHIPSNQLLRIPIPVFSNKQIYENLIKLVQTILNLNYQFQNSVSDSTKLNVQRQIDATDCEIDRLVYELYGLTEEEIKIVEDGAAK
jgi:type I restriction-modification system DNA methylase subunit